MTRSNHKLNQSEISILMFTILIATALILTLYVQMALPVMYYVTEYEGVPEWVSRPAGSFFPLPRPSGMLMALTPMNIIDQFIYTFLLKTWLLVGITIAYWIGAFIYASLLIRKL
ncbi:MAG: hypothetical protein ACFFDI_31935 [Promethearchaeota archaeon]